MSYWMESTCSFSSFYLKLAIFSILYFKILYDSFSNLHFEEPTQKFCSLCNCPLTATTKRKHWDVNYQNWRIIYIIFCFSTLSSIYTDFIACVTSVYSEQSEHPCISICTFRFLVRNYLINKKSNSKDPDLNLHCLP